MTKPLLLTPTVQHYAWGGYSFIPELIGVQNPEQKPFAELWMGSHPRGVSKVNLGGEMHTLPDFFKDAPVERLGTMVVKAFGPHLPFLFKILDVRRMLSIQSHPNKEQAMAGFVKENEAGIPIDAKYRNFKDDNHKPEIMVALTDFWLLHGFRPLEEIDEMLERISEFSSLKPNFAARDLKKLYAHVMTLTQEQVDQLLHPLRDRLNQEKPADKNQADYWAWEAFKDYDTEEGHSDRGIFSIYFLNLVKLVPGQSIFQAAGIPHAYLAGVNVELMANSDNVFRGGLTPKHIDPNELLAHLVFDSVNPKVIEGERVSATEVFYPSPAPDFLLSQITISPEQPHNNGPSSGPEIIINLEDAVIVNGEMEVPKGGTILIPNGAKYSLTIEKGAGTMYRASVPVTH